MVDVNPINPTGPHLGNAQPCCAARASRYALFMVLAMMGCAADLTTKSSMFGWLGEPQSGRIYWLIEGYVGFETALNEGALFGFGQKMIWLFVTMSFVALGGIGYWLIHKRAIDDHRLTVTLGIVTGGILGNLYDRLGFWSDFTIFAVRDWIRLSYDYHRYVWPNFNIADSLLVCGAGLLVWHSLRVPAPTGTQYPSKV